MRKLPKYLLHALDSLARAGKTWSITMTDDYATAATKLQEMGLVRAVPRLAKRGPFKGTHTGGSDLVVTPEGRAVLVLELDR